MGKLSSMYDDVAALSKKSFEELQQLSAGEKVLFKWLVDEKLWR